MSEGLSAWLANRNRLDHARVLHKLGRSAEALSLLEQLQQSMGAIAEPDPGERDLIEAAEELRAEIRGKGVSAVRTSKRQRLRALWRRLIP